MNAEQTPARAALQERASTQAFISGPQIFPGRKVEAWRYTPLTALEQTSWRQAETLPASRVEALLAALDMPSGEATESGRQAGRIVFANGSRNEAQTILPDGSVLSVSQDVRSSQTEFLFNAGIYERFPSQLNAALLQKGISVHVPAGVDGGILQLVSLYEGADISVHLRHRIVLEEGASLTLLDASHGTGRYLANPVFEIICGKNARLRHVKRQFDSCEAIHLGGVHAVIESHGDYDSFTLNQGGALARHDVVSILVGPYANTHVNAVQLVDGARLNDLTSMIHHAAPDCTSRQTVRTVLSDRAQGVFQGKILVDQIAQKTDGYQMNQALLLSETAQINSKPELEIYADDVKCSHGATVGALDEEQLFYLQSRGIPGEEARSMLVQAFLREAVELLDDETCQAWLLACLPHKPESAL